MRLQIYILDKINDILCYVSISYVLSRINPVVLPVFYYTAIHSLILPQMHAYFIFRDKIHVHCLFLQAHQSAF